MAENNPLYKILTQNDNAEQSTKRDYWMKIKSVIKGLLTFIPGIQKILPQKGTGGTNSAGILL